MLALSYSRALETPAALCRPSSGRPVSLKGGSDPSPSTARCPSTLLFRSAADVCGVGGCRCRRQRRRCRCRRAIFNAMIPCDCCHIFNAMIPCDCCHLLLLRVLVLLPLPSLRQNEQYLLGVRLLHHQCGHRGRLDREAEPARLLGPVVAYLRGSPSARMGLRMWWRRRAIVTSAPPLAWFC